MNELQLYNSLKHAWEVSTLSDNAFGRALDSVDWEETFYADGEHYFLKGGFIFTTPVLDPFGDRGDMSPSAVFSDRSMMSFYE